MHRVVLRGDRSIVCRLEMSAVDMWDTEDIRFLDHGGDTG